MTKITKYGLTFDKVVLITTERNNWRLLIENVLVSRAIGDLDRAIDGLNAQNIGLIYDRMIYGQFNDNNHTLKLEEHRVMYKQDRDKINKMDNKNQQQALKEFVTGRKENQI